MKEKKLTEKLLILRYYTNRFYPSFQLRPDNLATPTNVSYLFGEIKRGTDGRFYIPNMGAPANKIHSYTGSTWAGTVNIAAAS
jgi:hypothetical protein